MILYFRKVKKWITWIVDRRLKNEHLHLLVSSKYLKKYLFKSRRYSDSDSFSITAQKSNPCDPPISHKVILLFPVAGIILLLGRDLTPLHYGITSRSLSSLQRTQSCPTDWGSYHLRRLTRWRPEPGKPSSLPHQYPCFSSSSFSSPSSFSFVLLLSLLQFICFSFLPLCLFGAYYFCCH